MIWCNSYNLGNVKNTHGGVLLLVKLKTEALPHGCFSRFLNCANGTKSRKASDFIEMGLTKCNLFVYLFLYFNLIHRQVFYEGRLYDIHNILGAPAESAEK